MKDDRLTFCLWHETWTLHSKENDLLDIGGWDQVIFTDETSVIMGEHRGKGLITRTKDEEWSLDCMERAFKTNSTFMFWGSIAWGWKGPCHIYEKETPAIRAASKEELRKEDIIRWMKEEKIWLAKQEAIDLSLMMTEKKRQGTYPQFCNSFKLQLQSKGEGIDWYRYNRHILQAHLLPAYTEFKKTHPEALIMQDGCSNHTSHWNDQIFLEFNTDLLKWPGNSPDLNPIEHIWCLLKDRVAKRRPYIKGYEQLHAAWMDEWDKLDIEKDINPLIENLERRVKQVLGAEGRNNFHG